MKYEFHAGDYVETKDGRVGYITHVAVNAEPIEYYFMQIMRKENDYAVHFEGSEDLIPKKFNRIGQYDFTMVSKVREHTIEKLYTQGYLSPQTVAATVNELVDAVNELRAAQKGVE